MSALTIIWKYRKVIGIVLLILVIFGTIRWYGHTKYVAGAASVQVKWDADKAAHDLVVAQTVADANAKMEAAKINNEAIVNGYVKDINAAVGQRDMYFRMLQQARGSIRAASAHEATSTAIAATTGEALIGERIDRAIAGTIVESRNNADQLDALIAVVKPQATITH